MHEPFTDWVADLKAQFTKSSAPDPDEVSKHDLVLYVVDDWSG